EAVPCQRHLIESLHHADNGPEEPHQRSSTRYCCQCRKPFLELMYLQSSDILNCGGHICQRPAETGNTLLNHTRLRRIGLPAKLKRRVYLPFIHVILNPVHEVGITL